MLNIGIIGYGKMGASIFRWLATRPFKVTVYVRNKEKAIRHQKKSDRRLERSLKRKAITQEEFNHKKNSLLFTDQIEDLSPSDLVIETAVESYREKVEILKRLESVLNDDAVMLTNTSSISIEKLAQELNIKDRFCGLHFFYPLQLTGIVEIIKLASTPKQLLKRLKNFCSQIDKQPIVVLDAPGSVINAILAYYYVEALYILEEGLALPSKIDKLAKQFFYVGPCESIDVIGIDFLMKALERAATPGNILPIRWDDASQRELSTEETGGRQGFFVPFLFKKLISQQRFGKKTVRGVFIYKNEKAIDDASEYYINPDRRAKFNNSGKVDELVAKRLLYSVFNGVLYSFKKGMSSMEELDRGIKEVLHSQQGPVTMMQSIGKEELENEFHFLAQNVGIRFKQKDLAFLD